MNDNPKWQPFLDKLPTELHPIIKPELEAWDRGVQERIQEVHAQYAPYKEFIDQKVDPKIIDQGLDILVQLNDDAGAFVKRVDEVYKLNMFNQTTQPPVGNEGQAEIDYNNYEEYDGVDITQHPAFKQLASSLEQIQGQVQTQAEKDKEAQEIADYEAYLDTLNTKYAEQGGINRELVTAYMSQGLDGDAAVKAYQDQFTAMLAQQQEVANAVNQNNGQGQVGNVADNPPAVMGSSGTPGSGLPDTALIPGKWNTNQTVDAVTEMLRAASEQTQ